MKDGLYNKLAQEYYSLNTQKRNLISARNKADAQLEIVEDMLIAINDILCKHGKHIYECFEESEEQTGNDT